MPFSVRPPGALLAAAVPGAEDLEGVSRERGT